MNNIRLKEFLGIKIIEFLTELTRQNRIKWKCRSDLNGYELKYRDADENWIIYVEQIGENLIIEKYRGIRLVEIYESKDFKFISDKIKLNILITSIKEQEEISKKRWVINEFFTILYL